MTEDIMSPSKIAVLPNRGAVQVMGDDAEKLLQGLVTNDIAGLGAPPSACYAALLSPQGKLLFDFIAIRHEGGLILETSQPEAAQLSKRLSLYKLRADVTIADVSDQWVIVAEWGNGAKKISSLPGAIAYDDPRLAGLGMRALIPVASLQAMEGAAAPVAEYHAHRIAYGVPEGGLDFSYGDVFPHEALLDQLNGISFQKGCYVGQEIVARMEHRGTARKRIVPVETDAGLPERGTEILAGGVAIGILGSSMGNRGLAMVRLDRAAEFEQKGTPLSAGGCPIRIEIPAWATFSMSAADHA